MRFISSIKTLSRNTGVAKQTDSIEDHEENISVI